MLESISKKFEYQKLTSEEQQARGILGRLVGVIADYLHPTRNERWYSEKLWDKVFDDPIMKEKIKNRCVFGELGHPTDRTEINMEKVAICLAEPPKKSKDGKLYGVFDILSTPCGKILKSLCDYGCTIGISSRGSGDTFINNSGKEEVDADTYECECWDAVLLPAVETARLQFVNESLDANNAKLRKALNEELSKASEEDRKVMNEALQSLNINLGSTADSAVDHIDESSESTMTEAADDGADIAKEFLKTLKENKDLTKQVRDLQEQLSVCYTKENSYQESINKLQDEIKTLSESVAEKDANQTSIQSLNEQIRIRNALIENLNKRNEVAVNSKKSLTESLSEKDKKIASLAQRVNSLTEDMTKLRDEKSSEIKKLSESLEEMKKDTTIKRAEYQDKLQKSNALVERYKSIAKIAVNKYIDSQAKLLGVDIQDIKSRLNENYSFDDIDRICESLRVYRLDADSLPFDAIGRTPKVRIRVTESNEPIKRAVNGGSSSLDDECDEQLMELAKL